MLRSQTHRSLEAASTKVRSGQPPSAGAPWMEVRTAAALIDVQIHDRQLRSHGGTNRIWSRGAVSRHRESAASFLLFPLEQQACGQTDLHDAVEARRRPWHVL